MKKELLKEIIEYKKNKKEFAIITDLDNSQGFLYNRENLFPKDFIKYKDQILEYRTDQVLTVSWGYACPFPFINTRDKQVRDERPKGSD